MYSDSNRLGPASPVVLPAATTGLSAKGSISRGIQVSSNASVSLQSSMYLKIDGDLSDTYQVSGTLSEKTSALQPIGNTRRLNDFDRVLISVTGPALNADIGDIDLAMDNGRFGKLTRNIEGLHLMAHNDRYGAEMDLGFSYGRSQLQQIQGRDGKQGPYRLSGSNGEKYIIVLAGSEQVRLDDELLQRGAEDDYIIDYNAAEIHFTQNRILSANSRISVEFEYVPDIYLSSYTFGKQLMAAQVDLGRGSESPAHLSVSWQELKDDRNNPLGNIQTAELEGIFRDLGNETGEIWVNGAVVDSINGDYQEDGTGHLIYAGPGAGTQRVQFTYVGLEQGNYRKIMTADDSYFVFDSLNGEYLPAQKYIAPGSHGVLALDGGASWGPWQVSGELGLSRIEKNLYALDRAADYQPAWDLQAAVNTSALMLLVGDKYYGQDYLSHDPLESIEYYRKWQIKPRTDQAERLQYGTVRVGRVEEAFALANLSSMTRSDTTQGEQLSLSAQTDLNDPHWLKLKSSLTLLDSVNRHQHDLQGQLTLGPVVANAGLDLESGTQSAYFPPNDHLAYALGLKLPWGVGQELGLEYTQRQDYRFKESNRTMLSARAIEEWEARRRDYALSYIFRELLATQGSIQLKYRNQESDSSGQGQYFLGKAKLATRLLEDRLVIRDELSIDEEHIPRYDYHYVEVDTGYGEFSYDPLIRDYIAVDGGRYVRQRLYSDIEEQVRKFENKANLQLASAGFRDPRKPGTQLSLRHDKFTQLQVQSQEQVQGRRLLSAELVLRNATKAFLKELTAQFRDNTANSMLYSFGQEQSDFRLQSLKGDLAWNERQTSTVSMEVEQRTREIAYNLLATEAWQAWRPGLEHHLKLSEQQRYDLIYRFSRVKDDHSGQTYLEQYLKLQQELRFARRGRITQELETALISADVAGIPYSVFSGRQPGTNWKYGLTGRYIFSSRFQIMLNYSIRKRGEGRNEQFLRFEGRTHF